MHLSVMLRIKPFAGLRSACERKENKNFPLNFFAISFSNSPRSWHHTGFLEVSRNYLPLQNTFSDVKIKDTWVEADATDLQFALSCTLVTHLQNIQVSHRTWQVPLNITDVKDKSSKVRAEGAWRSTKYSSFPTEITKIEVLVKTVGFSAMHFISLPLSMNFPRRDCYFQLSSTQPIEMGESHYSLLKAKVSSSPVDPQPRFAEWKPSQSC